jgi:hypothetical protein
MARRVLNVHYRADDTPLTDLSEILDAIMANTKRVDVSRLRTFSEVLDAIVAEFWPSFVGVELRELTLLDDDDAPINSWGRFNALSEDYFLPSGKVLDLQAPGNLFHRKQINFCSAMAKCEFPGIGQDPIIRLPDNVFFLGGHDLGSALFVRDCYPVLLKKVMSTIGSKDSGNIAIIGTNGIGKRFFGFYLLMHLARMGATIVFEYVNGGHVGRCLISPEKLDTGCCHSFITLLESDQVFYIVDGTTPDNVRARTVLLCSPEHQFSADFMKPSCSVHHMPVWTFEEIAKCHDLVHCPESPTKGQSAWLDHYSISWDQVAFKFSKWGGIPLKVFEKCLEDDATLEVVLQKAPGITTLVSSFGDPDRNGMISRMLLHWFDDDGLNNCGYRFASEYVADRLFYRLFALQREFFFKYASVWTNERDPVSALRADLFKRFAHLALSKGGVFQIRELGNSYSGSSLVLAPAFSENYSMTCGHVHGIDKNYYYEVAVFQSIDSFMAPNRIFQVMTGKEKSVDAEELSVIVSLLGTPKTACFFYVVPLSHFSDTSLKKGVFPVLGNTVKQFVLAIESP